ncbi:MAG: DUF350 domain-containing protein [Rickettsiales bacterium]|jgi:uncharacterized membrane protein YjfL (UPF0719 family)|nr:DUF350 domain-containing protein [Rickettsiales bacterium]
MNPEHILFDDALKASAFIATYIALFCLAKIFKDILTSYNISDELVKKDNVAVSLTMSGYYLATSFIFVGALIGPSINFVTDLISVTIFSLLGLVFLNLSRWVTDKIILRKFCNVTELTKNKNLAVASVQFGTYIATGLIAAGAISGQGGGLISALIFFVLGQATLLIFSLIYDLLTPYCIHQELAKKNLAAGVAFSGTMIALGIIILNGIAGDFLSWKQDVISFLSASGIAFVFLPIIRIIMDRMVVPGSNLSSEISKDKNVGAGFLEASIAISFALILTQIF